MGLSNGLRREAHALSGKSADACGPALSIVGNPSPALHGIAAQHTAGERLECSRTGKAKLELSLSLANGIRACVLAEHRSGKQEAYSK